MHTASAWSQSSSALRAKVRPEVVGVPSEGIGPEGAHWRPRRKPERLVPRACTALAPAAAAAAKVPSKLGGERPVARGWREEGRKVKAAETSLPREPCAPWPRRGSYLKGQDGRGHLCGGGGFSRLRRSWHSWRRRRREGLSRDSAVPPPGTRRPDSPGQGWGEVVLSSVRVQSGAGCSCCRTEGLPPLGLFSWSRFLPFIPKIHKSTAST